MNPCFNLTEEKWIRVLEEDGSIKETTLPEVMCSVRGETDFIIRRSQPPLSAWHRDLLLILLL